MLTLGQEVLTLQFERWKTQLPQWKSHRGHQKGGVDKKRERDDFPSSCIARSSDDF